MNDITQYDEMQARFAAAYEYHKQTYTLKNPAPIHSKADGIDWKIIIGLLALVIFSIAVSGTRTVPEFGGGGSGWFAWGMLEVGAVILSYVLTKKFYDESKHKGVKRRLQVGSGLAVVVMLAANIHFEARVFGVELAAWLNLVIVILLSTSAPLLVWIAGEALGMEVVTAERRDLKVDKEWKEALALWHEGLNRSWDARKAQLGVEVRVVKDVNLRKFTEALPSGEVELENRRKFTVDRPSPALKKALDYLADKPDLWGIGSRDLVGQIGVSHMTISKAQRKLREEVR